MFTERGWSKLVKVVEQRNSTEGMSQLELVGCPTWFDDESGESEEEWRSNESDEECYKSEEKSGPG